MCFAVQRLSRVQIFATPWTTAHQVSLFFTISWSLLKLMSSESVMPSNHLILSHPLLLLPAIFPSIRVFSQQVAKVLELQLQHQSFQRTFRNDFLWDRLVWSPCCPRDSQVFSSTTVQKHQFSGVQTSSWSNSHIHTWPLKKTKALTTGKA